MFEFVDRNWSPRCLLALGLVLVGVGLAVTGVSVYVEATAAGCDGCSPFHPLFVVAPVGLGAVLTTAGGWLLGQE